MGQATVQLGDTETGEKRILSGDEAGKGTKDEFEFRYSRKETEKREGLGHTHGKGGGTGDKLRDNKERKSNNGPSKDDQVAMDKAGVPVVTVGPDVTTMMYRQGGQDYVTVIDGDASKVPDLSNQDIVVCGRDAAC